jgi:hypothetical protein
MWTPPVSQELKLRFDRIACDHMSGFSAVAHDRHQDGFRDARSKQF